MKIKIKILMIVCCFFLFSVSEMDFQFSSLPNMAQLVQFISGHPYLPFSGLDITFSQSAVYPDADSCFCFLRLPTIHNSYQDFRNAINRRTGICFSLLLPKLF